ncbi:type II toxin-antitoxin system RelE/ParE family toxin [Limnospira platensis CENA597]|uniref:type II toxin-antitoxin system RelE/ParE family toxin n=1 Tax=Limnospira platensis TaxID=118562 RepID=UPI003D6FA033
MHTASPTANNPPQSSINTKLNHCSNSSSSDSNQLEGIQLFQEQGSTGCSVETTDVFEKWWDTLSEATQIKVATVITLLQKLGVGLPSPYSSKIKGSKLCTHLRELRVQGHPYRILYAFDPNRTAILLVGGNKTNSKRWYENHICIAEQEYIAHICELQNIQT